MTILLKDIELCFNSDPVQPFKFNCDHLGKSFATCSLVCAKILLSDNYVFFGFQDSSTIIIVSYLGEILKISIWKAFQV